jgi:hypothetical protein
MLAHTHTVANHTAHIFTYFSSVADDGSPSLILRYLSLARGRCAAVGVVVHGDIVIPICDIRAESERGEYMVVIWSVRLYLISW